jgi:hypothetical protein
VTVTVTGVEAVTALVCTWTMAAVRPDGIVMVAGTGNAAELLAMERVAPPAGAGPLKVTVTAAGVPPGMVAGVMVAEFTVGRTTGATVAFAVLVVEL